MFSRKCLSNSATPLDQSKYPQSTTTMKKKNKILTHFSTSLHSQNAKRSRYLCSVLLITIRKTNSNLKIWSVDTLDIYRTCDSREQLKMYFIVIATAEKLSKCNFLCYPNSAKQVCHGYWWNLFIVITLKQIIFTKLHFQIFISALSN